MSAHLVAFTETSFFVQCVATIVKAKLIIIVPHIYKTKTSSYHNLRLLICGNN